MDLSGEAWKTLYSGWELMETAGSWSELVGLVHRALASVVDFDVASFLFLQETPGVGGTLEGYLGPSDPAWIESLTSHYLALVPPGFNEPLRDTRLGTLHPARDFPEAEFTREFLAPKGITVATCLMIPARAQNAFVTVNFNFTRDRPKAREQELVLLDSLRRHAETLLRLHDRIEGLECSSLCLQKGFTAREEQVAALAVRRLTAFQIAERLGISRRTVECHLLHLYQKTDVVNRKQLVRTLTGGSPCGAEREGLH